MADDRPYVEGIARFNDRIALWSVANVGTMRCAYIFAVLALVALPQALDESFGQGMFSPLPLVTWLSQSFLQLVLLSIIMAGQELQSHKAQQRHDDLAEQHAKLHERISRLHLHLTEGRHGG